MLENMFHNLLCIILACAIFNGLCADREQSDEKQPVEDMKNLEIEPDNAAQRAVQKSDTLCEGEKQYVQQRKKKVLESLQRLGFNCEPEDVPHIAVLFSGGGQRAAVGMLGSVQQMEQDGLLGTTLYMAGVSGSTWSMASLYRELEMNVSSVLATQRGPRVDMREAMGWLGDRMKQGNISLTHVWGALTSATVMKEMIQQRLSEEAKREAINPYPIYSAIDKHCHLEGPAEGAWFEITPHQSGFTDLGFYVDTPHLGSWFEAGELVHQTEEMDMIELQGVLGCALADEETIKAMMPDWMTEAEDLQVYIKAYQLLHTLVSLTNDGEVNSTLLTGLEKVLKDSLNKPPLDVQSSTIKEEGEKTYENWGFNFLKALELWCYSLEERPFKGHVCWVITHILPLVVKWEWGTTNNFLYKYDDPGVPFRLQNRTNLQLIDAGLMINAPYPPFLGPRRKVDLMLALDYSAGNIFETVQLAQNHSRKMGKPFPQLDPSIVEEREQPRDFYVFEGQDDEPTIIYMPLFNLQNCQNKEEIAKEREEYTTFQLPYSAEKIDYLVEKARGNMKDNKQKILQQIDKAVQKKKKQRKAKTSVS